MIITCPKCGQALMNEDNRALTEDVIKVVHCKDCRHYEYSTVYNKHFCNEYGGYVVENDFCSRAENGR